MAKLSTKVTGRGGRKMPTRSGGTKGYKIKGKNKGYGKGADFGGRTGGGSSAGAA